jgi:hypothetical protein
VEFVNIVVALVLMAAAWVLVVEVLSYSAHHPIYRHRRRR